MSMTGASHRASSVELSAAPRRQRARHFLMQHDSLALLRAVWPKSRMTADSYDPCPAMTCIDLVCVLDPALRAAHT